MSRTPKLGPRTKSHSGWMRNFVGSRRYDSQVKLCPKIQRILREAMYYQDFDIREKRGKAIPVDGLMPDAITW